MLLRTPLVFTTLLLSLLTSLTTAAQQVADTVYFDETWSVCERPVAEFYRVCTLNKIDQLYYKGDASDYYINGELEMTGHYDSKGSKKGHFIFYGRTGNKTKEGNYDNDRMTGVWSFYDKNGKIKAQFNCLNSANFTPLLIIDNKGDTLVKNGNGKFSFNSSTDLPEVFSTGKSYYVSGEVVNGKKEGRITYSINASNEGSSFQEYYENGKFVKAVESNPVFKQSEERNTPYTFLDLQPEKLLRVDKFYSDNLVFSLTKNKDEQLIRFLLLKETPQMISNASTYEDNTTGLFSIIGTVIRKFTVKEYMQKVSFSNPPTEIKSRLLSFTIPGDSAAPAIIEDTAEIDIDTAGYVRATSFKGNLTVKSIKMINFYLEHLSNLVPYSVAGVKKASKLIIHLYTLIKPDENEPGKKTISYSYFASCDSTDSAGAGNAEAGKHL